MRLENAHTTEDDGQRHGGDDVAQGGVVMQADHRGQDQQADQVHDLDQRVDGRAGGVLERVADGVADHGRLVGLRTLAALVAVLDVLLGVVPGTAGVVEEVGHQLAGEDGPGQEGAQGQVADGEADHDGRRGWRAGPGVASSRWAAAVQMSMTRPYSGRSVRSMIPGCSRNCRRTSSTTVPADRPTARMASDEKRKAMDPPISRPMNVFGLATLMIVCDTLV